MRRKVFLFFFFLLFAAGKISAQASSWRDKSIAAKSDTVTLDTLSIVATTFEISSNGKKLDSTQYKLLPAEAELVLSANAPHNDLQVHYAVYPLLFTKSNSHKDEKTFTSKPDNRIDPFLYKPGETTLDDPFAMGGLNKSGSLSRGITFGNTRDVSVNSSLNLQLSGKISDDVDLTMVATDDNLPIQPDGTTQQLQEFDKVYIQLSGKGTKLIAGDFTATRPSSYFMNYNKRGQGLMVTSEQHILNAAKKDSSGILKVSGSVALSKGKFARNVIQGIEGNQGPYRLHGAENEFFIVILSGTEKVFIDGKQLMRGQENDYTINYNTGEITFTAKQLITKDKRITVEFQYSDRNYSRTLATTGIEYDVKGFSVRLNAYSEQDAKNQPLQQTLTDDDKLKMAAVGDTLLHAVVPGIDSVAFSGDKVLYKKTDTLVNSILYSNVYVYSISPDSAHFRLSFSYVGLHNGNYVQYSTSANGKTFRWIAPVNGVLQGDYEPVILLITPKKKQMVTLGGTLPTSLGKFETELAYSSFDQNTFSPFDSQDDKGYGGNLKYTNEFTMGSSQHLGVQAHYEYVSRYFSPIERFRPVEFERDWNFGYGNSTPHIPTADQHLAGVSLDLKGKKSNVIGYDYSMFDEGTAFRGAKNAVNVNWADKKTSVTGKASVLETTGIFGNSSFIRQNVKITRAIYKKWSVAGSESQEMNRSVRAGNDSLILPSAGFFEWEGDLNYNDSSKRTLTFFYKQRSDLLPDHASLSRATFAENFGSTVEMRKNPDRDLRVTASYRKLDINSPLLTSQQPDNTVVGRAEYNLRMWKGVVSTTTFYETGSGLEVKKEYSYIEVPAGQGSYTWTDYNGDGVKQLNEFETALYSDQANYIRVFTPTNQYVKVYTNQFSQSLNLKPAVKWANEKGVKGFAGKFSDMASYRVDRKTMSNDPAHIYVPTVDDARDTQLVTLNSTIRNTITFNQLSSKFGIEHTYQDVRGKNLLTNGLESRANTYHDVHVRWNMTKSLSLVNDLRDGHKSSSSEFFSTRNYRIHYTETENKFSIQPGTTFRVSFSYRYSMKKNLPEYGNENAVVQKFGTEVKLSKLSKGSFVAEGNYYRITYSGVVNSSVGYDMLEGLKPGENFTWRITWQRSLATNLQLTLGYEGRKTPGSIVVHSGTAQVRAIF
ncbi:MAG: hypothetical protein HY064_10890 [Bacteroidetes bacterium]|nr:hypothetical protein [Bacteroidota bacterium]